MKNNKIALKIITIVLSLLLVFGVSGCSIFDRTVDFSYTLTENDVAEAKTNLDNLQTLLIDGTNEIAIAKEFMSFEGVFYKVMDQAVISRILFDNNPSDETAKENYLFASDAQQEIYKRYMLMCQAIDDSYSPYKTEFFSEWTESDFAAMRSYTGSIAELNKANNLIDAEFEALSDDEMELNAGKYLLRKKANNNEIAKLAGSTNYVDYAYENEYSRDYKPNDVTTYIEFVKEYIAPLAVEAYSRYMKFGLEYASKSYYNDFVDIETKAYDTFDIDYYNNYISSYERVPKNTMKSLMKRNAAYFGDNENSNDAAYTTYLLGSDQAVCYFGNGSYRSLFTVVHETGHYYHYTATAGEQVSIDLAEVHSQGNEMLFLSYLKSVLPTETYNLLESYQLYESFSTIIVAAIVDEFEQYVYTHDIAATELDGIMNNIVNSYGSEVKEIIGDMNYYWKAVTVTNPLYYISYSVSLQPSVNLFLISNRDGYTQAQNTYVNLVKSEKESFLEALADVNLSSPFVEAYYTALSSYFDNYWA